MKPAPCSWRVRIRRIFFERDRLSRKSRFSSPGTPKTYSTPSSSRHEINRSEALVIGSSLGSVGRKAAGRSPGLPYQSSDDAIGQHGIGDFLEAGNVGAADIINMAVLFLAIFQAARMDALHDVLQELLEFFF